MNNVGPWREMREPSPLLAGPSYSAPEASSSPHNLATALQGQVTFLYISKLAALIYTTSPLSWSPEYKPPVSTVLVCVGAYTQKITFAFQHDIFGPGN